MAGHGLKKFLCMLAAVMGVLTGCSSDMEEEILRIEDYPVTQEEFCVLMDKQKSQIYNYFTQVHQIQPGDLEWDKEYEEDVPADMLINQTVEKLQQDVFVLQKAEQEGLIESDAMASIKAQWEEDQKESGSGEIIYGPEEKEYYEFYDYYLAELEGKVRTVLWEEADVSRD